MSDQNAEIAALLVRLTNGEREVLGELFTRHRESLRRMVELRLDHQLNGRVSPSDVLQEAFIDAQQRLDHFLARDDMPFGLWLRLITGQCLVDVHRRHLGAAMRAAGAERPLDFGAPMASSICLAAHLVGKLSSPSHAAMKDEMVRQIHDALESLEPLDREVLALRHFEELGNNEVAEVLGLQKHAASKRYVRALGRLREALAKIPGFLNSDDKAAP